MFRDKPVLQSRPALSPPQTDRFVCDVSPLLFLGLNPVVPDIFNKPGLPGGANLPHLLFCFVFTAARSADVLFQTKLSIDLDSKDAGVRIIFLIRLG